MWWCDTLLLGGEECVPSHPSIRHTHPWHSSLTPIPHTIPHTHPSHYALINDYPIKYNCVRVQRLLHSTHYPSHIPCTHPSHSSLTLIPHTMPHTHPSQPPPNTFLLPHFLAPTLSSSLPSLRTAQPRSGYLLAFHRGWKILVLKT